MTKMMLILSSCCIIPFPTPAPLTERPHADNDGSPTVDSTSVTRKIFILQQSSLILPSSTKTHFCILRKCTLFYPLFSALNIAKTSCQQAWLPSVFNNRMVMCNYSILYTSVCSLKSSEDLFPFTLLLNILFSS